MKNLKDKLTNYLAVLLVLIGSIKAYLEIHAGQPIDWQQLLLFAISALIAYFTGKNPDGTAKNNDQVNFGNTLGKAVGIVILLLFLSINGQSQPHLLRYYPVSKKTTVMTRDKKLKTSQTITYESKDSSLFFGPSIGFDVFQIETKTSSYQIGLIPGIGYGLKWNPKGGSGYLLSLDIFLKTGLIGSSATNGPKYFIFGVTPVISVVNGWIRIGYGPQWSVGLNGTANKYTGVLTLGTAIILK